MIKWFIERNGVMFLIVFLLFLGIAYIPKLGLGPQPAPRNQIKKELTMYVAAETFGCWNASEPCLLVKFHPNAPWERFREDIRDFDYEPGFHYELRIRQTDTQIFDPYPGYDRIETSYRLLEVVSKTVYTPPPNEKEFTIYVAARKPNCIRDDAPECFFVKYDPNDVVWDIEDGQIEGFTYEPGFNYELRVRQIDTPSGYPPDRSWPYYELIEVVSKTAVSSTPDTPTTDTPP